MKQIGNVRVKPWFIVAMVATLLGAWGAFAANGDRDDPAPASITIINRFRLSPQAPGGTPEIELAAFSAGEDDSSPALALVWRKDPTSWFNVWNLELAGPLVSDSGAARMTLYETTNVPWGHELEAGLSYDQATGLFSVHLRDVSAARTVHRQQGVIGRPEGAASLHALSLEADANGATLLTTEVAPVFVPVGLGSRLTDWPSGGQILHAYIGRDTHSHLALSLNSTPVAIDGTFRLEAGDPEDPLQVHQNEDGVFVVPIDRLPLGPQTLRLVYGDRLGGQWTIEQFPITIGAVRAAFYIESISTGPPNLTARLVFEADGPFHEVYVDKQFCFVRWYWDDRGELASTIARIRLAPTYLAQLSSEQIVIPVDVPIPLTPHGLPWGVALDLNITAQQTQDVYTIVAPSAQALRLLAPLSLGSGATCGE